ncbi:glycosyltransferase [Endozoicomonas arenosclerae]|uniref:glycosyltransferase n=1 Tax=Endozoicomonas arenosclerae TaxID=1633495 RepID=UPI0007827C0B|nr:glycosyltransferase [Endozoicomonas arenosclerae]
MSKPFPPVRLSIIVPLGPNEPRWPALLDQFSMLPKGSEIILTGFSHSQRPTELDNPPEPLRSLKWIWCVSDKGRALQLNTGAAQASGDYLWFIHADSVLTQDNIQSLLTSIQQNQERLYYFDLWFYDKETRWLSINEWGAKFRSNKLGAPYGDQGLSISRSQFFELGGYPTDADYGEDHLFVWKARQRGIQLQPCHTKLATSARKYHDYGWLKLTLRYQYLWLLQATPEFIKLLKTKTFQ